MKFIDTHIHLQDYKARYTTDILSSALSAGVTKFICCGTSPQDWDKVAELSRQGDGRIIPAFGLHPWYIEQGGWGWEQQLEHQLRLFPDALVGECGLDGLKSPPIDKQLDVFRRHIHLAKQYSRPLIIHLVKAQTWLEQMWQELPAKFVLHSFSGSPEFAAEVSRRGGYVSFGLSLFRHKRAAKLVQSVPQEQILLETDGPWQPLPSEDTSRPEQLPQLAQYIAALRGEDTDDFTAAVYHNSEEFINVRK